MIRIQETVHGLPQASVALRPINLLKLGSKLIFGGSSTPTLLNLIFKEIVGFEHYDLFSGSWGKSRSQAESAANKRDREFWLQLAHRWERLLQAGATGIEVDQKPSFERPFFRKKSKQFAKRRAA